LTEAPSLENDNLRLNFDTDGVLQEWVVKKEQKTFKFQQAFHWYKGFDHDNDQRSGAYSNLFQQIIF
jgi:hypothetical protein